MYGLGTEGRVEPRGCWGIEEKIVKGSEPGDGRRRSSPDGGHRGNVHRVGTSGTHEGGWEEG